MPQREHIQTCLLSINALKVAKYPFKKDWLRERESGQMCQNRWDILSILSYCQLLKESSCHFETWPKNILAPRASSHFHIQASWPCIYSLTDTLEKRTTNVPSVINHLVKLGIWRNTCSCTQKKRLTNVNSATKHSPRLEIWRDICWLTVERRSTVAPIATNRLAKLEIWGHTCSHTVEWKCTTVKGATSHSV